MKTTYKIKKGKKIDGFISNGNHYIETDGTTYQLYSENGSRLSAGNIKN